MVRSVLLAVVLALAAFSAEAQPRPPSGVGTAPSQPAGPPPPRGLFFFFDLFGPRPPSAPPPVETPRATTPSVPSGSADRGSSGEPKPAPPPVIAPYEADLVRIAEIMGALHYLRPLCGAPEGNRWRGEMQALVEAEAPTEDRKDKLIRGFNRGYAAFARTYRICTPAADLAVARYLEEGAKLTHDIVARYGN